MHKRFDNPAYLHCESCDTKPHYTPFLKPLHKRGHGSSCLDVGIGNMCSSIDRLEVHICLLMQLVNSVQDSIRGCGKRCLSALGAQNNSLHYLHAGLPWTGAPAAWCT